MLRITIFTFLMMSPEIMGQEQDSTRIDFTEAQIEGKMRAPQGFFLQGRKSQAMSQMVRLRSHFRKQLKDSKAHIRRIQPKK